MRWERDAKMRQEASFKASRQHSSENTMKNCKKIKVFESDLFRSADKKGGEEQFHRFFEKIENKINLRILYG